MEKIGKTKIYIYQKIEIYSNLMDLLKKHIYDRLMLSTTSLTGDVDIYAPYVFNETMVEITKEGKIDGFIITKHRDKQSTFNSIKYTTNLGWSATINIDTNDIVKYLRDYIYTEYVYVDYRNT